MGKVFLIEPLKVLRQAISLSLFPEHDVMVEGDIGASQVASFKDYDLLIVDAAALRERNRLTPDIIQAIQGCKTPTVWLEEDPSSHTVKREKLVIVKKPIEKEPFQLAVAGLLSPPGHAKERNGSLVTATAKGGAFKGTAKKGGGESLEQSAFRFIDLVDVVDDQPPPKQGKKAPRKSK